MQNIGSNTAMMTYAAIVVVTLRVEKANLINGIAIRPNDIRSMIIRNISMTYWLKMNRKDATRIKAASA